MKKINRRNFLALCKSTGIASLYPFGTPLYASNLFQYQGGLESEVENDIDWPKYAQEFPSLAIDDQDNSWVAALERDIPNKNIRVLCYKSDEIIEVAKIKPKGITGLSDPHIRSCGNSMMLVFSFEKNDRWEVAYSIIDEDRKTQKINVIENTGKVNISPVLAEVNGNACILWESNNGGKRGIYASHISKNNNTKPQRLTNSTANSYNPTIVGLSNGDMFAAWDTMRNESADIYGAWFKNGKWQPEIRLTSDARIERHPFLTNHENEIWMCWEAQSYVQRFSNNLTEQRIVVAKIENNGLLAPKHLFEQISLQTHVSSNITDTPWILHYNQNPEKCYHLVRPRIAFDQNGALWLSAREFMKQRRAGSRPVIWNYQHDAWSEKQVLLDQQGKRQAVEIAFGKNKGFAVYQYDNLPTGGGGYQGVGPDWKSGFGLSELPVDTQKGELITEQLQMPSLDFSLKEKITITSADLPKLNIQHEGNNLSLFFGDLHNHTDISVCRRSWNPTAKDDFAIARDIEKLDFCGLTDHGYNLDPPQWDFIGEQVRRNHDDNRFVTFLGEEWTNNKKHGHHNLIFLDPYYPHFYDAFDGDVDPGELWKELQEDGANFICIPHQLADMGTNVPINWDYVSEEFQPVAEIFQGRESYEYLGCPRQAHDGDKQKGKYLQDVWEKGNIIGVIASPDHWGGIGKTAVWAKDLSRESLFEAIRSRHTYGTTGAKMGLVFKTQQALMGDKVLLSSNPDYKFQVKAWANENINKIVIFRNNEIIYTSEPGEKDIDVEWEDKNPLESGFAWYYTRIQCEDDELAWSSPIWYLEKMSL